MHDSDVTFLIGGLLRSRRFTTVVTAIFVAMLLAPVVANAQVMDSSKRIPLAGASECFHGAPTGELIASLTPGGSPSQEVKLTCGTPTYGVLHIDSGHPIDENGADDVNVNGCFNHIFARPYYEIPASPGYTGIQYKRSDGGTASLIWQNSDGQVITMFTSDAPSGNNWHACATG